MCVGDWDPLSLEASNLSCDPSVSVNQIHQLRTLVWGSGCETETHYPGARIQSAVTNTAQPDRRQRLVFPSLWLCDFPDRLEHITSLGLCCRVKFRADPDEGGIYRRTSQ